METGITLYSSLFTGILGPGVVWPDRAPAIDYFRRYAGQPVTV